jgi:GDP-L-fucose synthase
VFVAGHRGLVGSALVRRLQSDPSVELLLRSRAELDLTNQAAVREFFERERPAQVYLAAARVGGILANDTRPAEFIQDNLVIQSNVIDAAYRNGTSKLLFLGSSCIYLKSACSPGRWSPPMSGMPSPRSRV